jgi:hypothetical protein
MQKTITIDGKRIPLKKAAAIASRLFEALRKDAREHGERRVAQTYCDAQLLMEAKINKWKFKLEK